MMKAELVISNNETGFTLVELSIVIIIIGLLVGGVLVGQELINQSKLKSLIKSVSEYDSAVMLFKNKYKCLPGDCKKASSFIDVNAYNGNGDNLIDWNPSTNSETFYTWQHLGLAKFIKGTYTGEYSTTNGFADIGNNMPKVDGYNAGITLFYRPLGIVVGGGGGTSTFGQGNRHMMIIGSQQPIPYVTNVLNRNFGGFLVPMDAYDLDTKLDDGNPGTGIINSNNGAGESSTNAADNCTASRNTNAFDGSVPTDYSFLVKKPVCMLVIWKDL